MERVGTRGTRPTRLNPVAFDDRMCQSLASVLAAKQDPLVPLESHIRVAKELALAEMEQDNQDTARFAASQLEVVTVLDCTCSHQDDACQQREHIDGRGRRIHSCVDIVSLCMELCLYVQSRDNIIHVSPTPPGEHVPTPPSLLIFYFGSNSHPTLFRSGPGTLRGHELSQLDNPWATSFPDAITSALDVHGGRVFVMRRAI